MTEVEAIRRHGRIRIAAAAALLVAALMPLTIGSANAAGDSARTHTAEHDDTLVTEKLRIGPLNLGVGQDAYVSEVVPRPAGDFVLKHFSADIVYDDGTPTSREDLHLHHIAIARLFTEDPACPSRVVGGQFPNIKTHVILASGAERTPIDIGDPFGYFEPKGSWGANYHVMNTSDTSQSVYLEYTIKYLKGIDHPELVPTTPYFMDVVGDCGTAQYDVPGSGDPTTTHTRTWDFTIPQPGTVLGTGGHLHNHGIATELYDGVGKLLCRSEAVYGPGGGHTHSAELPDNRGQYDEAVNEMTTCPWVMEPVDQGEVLELRSIYHNENTVRDAMGINITMIAHNWLPPPEWFPQQVTTTTAAPTTSTTAPASTSTTTSTTTSMVAPPPAPIPATPSYTG